MIALIKYEKGELITFNMSTSEAEQEYVEKFGSIKEDTVLTLGKHGKIPKRDILILKQVKNKKQAEVFHKGILLFLKNMYLKLGAK